MLILNAYTGVTDTARLLKKRLRQAGVKTSISQTPASGSKTSVIVNWADTNKVFDDLDLYSIVFNYSKSVAEMSNRLHFLMNLGVRDWVVDWTVLPMIAAQWGTGFNKVVCHFNPTENHRPDVFLWCQDDGVPLPSVPLYTRFTPRTAEYRVHISRNWGDIKRSVFFVERKIFVPSGMDPYPKKLHIRNSRAGFFWVKNPGEYSVPQEVLDAATDAMITGFQHLHFCAIDVLYHADKKQAWVLKGTTAPILRGPVADAYAEYFVRNYRNIMERSHAVALHPTS